MEGRLFCTSLHLHIALRLAKKFIHNLWTQEFGSCYGKHFAGSLTTGGGLNFLYTLEIFWWISRFPKFEDIWNTHLSLLTCHIGSNCARERFHDRPLHMNIFIQMNWPENHRSCCFLLDAWLRSVSNPNMCIFMCIYHINGSCKSHMSCQQSDDVVKLGVRCRDL